MIRNIGASALLLILACADGAAAAPTKIGAAGAVSGVVKAMEAQETVGRILQSGKPLFLNDHVTTDSKGRLQVMLLDETVFTIGPNSDMVLDEFVYDPATGAGKVSAKITKGVFRFVTGKVARKDPANMKVKLAVGTIGIRGTIAAGTTGEQGSTVILLGPGAQNNANENSGAITVENGASSVLIDQPGFGVNVTPGQQTISVTDMSAQVGQITSSLSTETSEAPAGEGQPAGGGAAAPSGSEESGQTTALAGVSLGSSADSSLTAQIMNNTASQAQQDIVSNPTIINTIANGIASWDNVRSIESGLATYSGSGLTSDPMFTMNLDLKVDFGKRIYGGNGSSLSLSGMEMTDATTISQNSFSALTGPAAITLVAGQNSDNSQFDNTTLTFNNLNEVAANSVTVGLNYIPGGQEVGEGEQPVVITGQLTAPREP